MQSAIREAAKSLGLAGMDLPRGAVHDAQQMAKLAPFSMTFVPSLYRSVLLVDTQLDRK
jgi:hypothetical protein